ncbi:M14 family metallopeptidase [Falsibacillus pallidus]|uniref:M14 family metallopeptidase n=1 Tax=Falsibacillus pallidus TaxID=493781 RepID=UPI003D96A8E9
MKRHYWVLSLLIFLGGSLLTEKVRAANIYFQVNSPASVYESHSGKLTEIAAVDRGFVFIPTSTSDTNWFKLKWGKKDVYIHRSVLTSVSKINQSIIPDQVRANSIIVSVKESVPVYDSTDKQHRVAVMLTGGQFMASGAKDGMVELKFAGRKGYIEESKVSYTFSPNTKWFETLEDNLPFFDNSGGKLTVKGTLSKGFVFKRVRSYSANWHEVSIGGEMRYVASHATKPALNLSGVDLNQGPKHTAIITPQKDKVIVEQSNGGLVTYSLLKAGESIYSNSPVGSDWYQVMVAGRKGFIHSSDLTVRAVPKDVVNPYRTYTYDQMQRDIKTLAVMYPDLIHVESIGKSVDGRDLTALALGKGNIEFTANAAHHARENITTNFVMEAIDEYAYAYESGAKFNGYDVRSLLNKVKIWFVPMVNPDGVTLVQKGYTSAKNPAYVLKLNGGSKNFSGWKANIRGVDLNRQYDADWAHIAYNTGRPGPKNYKGPYPFSEPEAIAMRDFTLNHSFQAGFAFHTSGQILYWYFKQGGSRYEEDKKLAVRISKMTGTSMVPVRKNPSGGGYTDWFIEKIKKPGFTPEFAPYAGEGPVPIRNFNDIWKRNQNVLLLMADYLVN